MMGDLKLARRTRHQRHAPAILPCPAGRDSPGRHLLFLTGPRDSGSDPGRAAQLFDAFLLSLGVPFYCIEITSEKMRGWLRLAISLRYAVDAFGGAVASGHPP
jgi:hypothetical protein